MSLTCIHNNYVIITIPRWAGIERLECEVLQKVRCINTLTYLPTYLLFRVTTHVVLSVCGSVRDSVVLCVCQNDPITSSKDHNVLRRSLCGQVTF